MTLKQVFTTATLLSATIGGIKADPLSELSVPTVSQKVAQKWEVKIGKELLSFETPARFKKVDSSFVALDITDPKNGQSILIHTVPLPKNMALKDFLNSQKKSGAGVKTIKEYSTSFPKGASALGIEEIRKSILGSSTYSRTTFWLSRDGTQASFLRGTLHIPEGGVKSGIVSEKFQTKIDDFNNQMNKIEESGVST